MNNFVKYKQHVLAKNSEAFTIWNAAERAQGEERKVLLRKLDQHLKLLDQQHRQLLERYDT
jgi:predicted metal-dependent hydrolase